jgi:hypothetical protein
MRRFIASIGLAASACNLSTEPIDQIELGLSVEPAEFAAGDSVQFIATAFNPTDETVQIGRECGPSFDVIVTKPDGSKISVLSEMNPGGAYTCPLLSLHFADPGETERMTLRWRVPLESGEYEAVARLRRPESYTSRVLSFAIP